MLQIPVDPAEANNGALRTFNNYLRSLDGFPPDSTASTTFSGAVDSTSLAEGVVVYDATAGQMLMPQNAVPGLDSSSAGKGLVISTTSRWTSGHTYLVAVFSWQDSTGVHGVRGGDGTPVLADTAFSYLRSETPLYGMCQDASNPACACPDLTTIGCHTTVDGLTDAQALQLEAGRQGIKPLIDTVVMQQGRMRSDLVMAWSFTISQRSFATFDLARTQAPFPSNLLLSNFGLGDPMADAAVKLPILPTDPPNVQALKTALNTLDGFTTTGSVQFPIDVATDHVTPVDIDGTTLIPGQTVFLSNLTTPTQQPSYTAQPLHAIIDPVSNVSGFAGQIWVTPQRPLLGDRTTYLALLTTAVKDIKGQNLVPSPVTVLLTQSAPLVTSSGGSAVSILSAAQALQLEVLRKGFAPLLAQLQTQGILPSSIAAFTVYRTQGIVKPIASLLAAQAQLTSVATGVTIRTVDTSLTGLGLDNLSAVVHGLLTVRRVVDLRGPFDTSRLADSDTNNDVIPFMMTLPTKALAPSGAPVVIAQHGLTRWRGDTLAIANTLAGQGMAMMAIDVIYHGGRVICLSNADCANGVTCLQPAPVNNQPQPGTCQGGAYLPSPTATPIPGTSDVLPDISLPNRDFTNLANPLAARDNFRQHVLDLFQLVRIIKETASNGVTAQLGTNPMLPPLLQNKIGYLGQSLGAILGADFLALSPDVNLGVLNVGGGDLVDIFTDPSSSLSVGVAAELGVTPGTPQFFALLENFRWFLDPADPINLGRYVRTPNPTLMPTRTAAKVILQEAGMDMVISNKFTQALGIELGLPLDGNQHLEGIDQEGTVNAKPVTTFFPAADHGAIFDFANLALTLQIQGQASTYLATGLGGAAPTVQ